MEPSQNSSNKTATANDSLSIAPSRLDTKELNFPSYLRVSGIFAEHFLWEIRRRRGRDDLGAASPFSRAQASVAIV